MIRFNNGVGVVALLLIFGMSIPLTTQGQSTDEVKQAIANNFKAMGQAMQAGDAATLATYFTEDAFFKLPGQPPVKGRKAIQEVHEQMIANGTGIRPITGEVQVYDDHVLELGSVDMLGKDGAVMGRAYYLTQWVKVDGEWKIHWDVVSGMPAENS